MAQSQYSELHKGPNQHPIPSTTTSPQNPGDVLYLNVWYDNNDMESWVYLPNSGFYPLTSGIYDFAIAARDGAINTNNRTDPLPPPTAGGEVVPVITIPCYVLFQIPSDTPGFNLIPASGPIEITTSCNNGTYFRPKRLHDIESDPSSAVHTIYFRANSPPQDQIDGFNLNTMDGVIDPDIKNTGRPPGTHVT